MPLSKLSVWEGSVDLYNIELEEALGIILKSSNPIKKVEEVNLMQTLGRVIAEDFYAPMDNPPFDRSPLDGFAIRAEDSFYASDENPLSFEVIDTVYAGMPSSKNIGSFQAIRIMTGGKMPSGSNTVIRIEDCEVSHDRVVIKDRLKTYQNYCFQGEDIKKGKLLINKGTKLSAIDLGILGSMGQKTVKVIGKPQIGILVTGDEIIDYSSELIDGKIYDTNGIMLGSRLKELGLEYKMIKPREDNVKAIAQGILDNIDDLDLIITTGGVSVGDRDLMDDVVKEINAKQLFWRLNFKPGSPAMYSVINDKGILSLSGNPFAALATFELMARPLIANISGDSTIKTKRVRGKILKDFNKKSPNRRFIRGIYQEGEIDLPEGGHLSGMLLSMRNCNALIDIEAGNTGIKKGEEVEIILL